MKRNQDRDSPSKSSKRSRSSASRFEDSPRDHLTPERDRGPRSPSGKPNNSSSTSSSNRHVKHRAGSGAGSAGGTPDRHLTLSRVSHENSRETRDDYATSRSAASRSFAAAAADKEYRILCVSGFSHRLTDASIRDGVFREFKKFGDIDVKLVSDNSERYAYVYFRTADDARDARHTKSKLILFEKPVLVEPIFESSDNRRGGGRSGNSLSPDLVSSPYSSSKRDPGSRPRGVSPSHSTSSSSSLQRRTRRTSIERALPLLHAAHNPPHHHDTAVLYRREGGVLPPPHPDFLPPPHAAQLANLRRTHEEKKEKFPNYLHHIPPEEDDKANRTLFIGNLEVNITEAELRRIFERYGVVEDIDIKRPPPGQGNAYAFIKFLNLDMAHKSKVEMSGQYIGKFQCKIGYGKAIPTTRIWVGGLGSWTSLSGLEREFDRFGAIKKIDFVKGDNHAYILYDSIDAAQAACKEMRGFPLGGPSKRLRVDFADAGPYNFHQAGSQPRPPQQSTYVNDEDPYYRPRLNHDHPGIRGAASDHYYYGSRGESDDHYSARWSSGGDYGPGYDPYPYDRRTSRVRIHDDWSVAYDRDRHDYWAGRDYPTSWRDGGGGGAREWTGEQRRKRPRSPDDLHYESSLPSRGSASASGDVLEGRYRQYPRQRTPPDGPPDISPPPSRRRRSPSPPVRGYRSRDVSRERDMTPPVRGALSSGSRDRRRSRTPEGPERSSRSQGTNREADVVVKTENGRGGGGAVPGSRDSVGVMFSSGSGGGISSSTAASSDTAIVALPDGEAERLVNATNISDVARILPSSWQGGLVLKNSFFPIKMHACEGDTHLLDTLIKDAGSGDTQVLRITQRLRLDQPKLDDVAKRLGGVGFCVLLGMACAISEDQPPQSLTGGAPVQQRPLRNLVSYLKQKEAAGVISLSGGKDGQGVLYAFPPCRFSQERMRRIAPAITDEGLKEDHLIIAVVRGSI